MRQMTRREWYRLAMAGVVSALAAPARTEAQAPGAAPSQPTGSVYKGVTLGVQSYSFRGYDLPHAIDAMRKVGLTSCELWQSHLEPRGVSRDLLRRWRETVPLDEITRVRQQFAGAGIQLSAYNVSFTDTYTDAEISHGFEIAQALGASAITSSSNIKTVPRVARIAAKHGMPVGMHNHSRIDPNEFATPENFEEAMKAGPLIRVNLDIGHFTAANFDAVDFLRRHHASIVTLHIKDRRKNQGPNVPFGEGDTPIGPVLRLLRDEKWDIPANIEYEYRGGDTIEEVRRCLEYCRKQLDT